MPNSYILYYESKTFFRDTTISSPRKVMITSTNSTMKLNPSRKSLVCASSTTFYHHAPKRPHSRMINSAVALALGIYPKCYLFSKIHANQIFIYQPATLCLSSIWVQQQQLTNPNATPQVFPSPQTSGMWCMLILSLGLVPPSMVSSRVCLSWIGPRAIRLFCPYRTSQLTFYFNFRNFVKKSASYPSNLYRISTTNFSPWPYNSG